jgi:DNA polymerase delta subunit 1
VRLTGQADCLTRQIFTLDSCAPIHHTRVVGSSDEILLLQSFWEFFHQVDPDIISGFNSNAFDIVRLMQRASWLGINNFANWSRLQDTEGYWEIGEGKGCFN